MRTRRTGTRFSLIVARRSVSVLVVGKGDWLLLCAAPEGPFRQKVPVPFSLYIGPSGNGPRSGVTSSFLKITISNHSIPTANGNINSPAMS